MLMYLGHSTQPNITFIISYLACFINSYSTAHWKALKCVLHYLQVTRYYAITYNMT